MPSDTPPGRIPPADGRPSEAVNANLTLRRYWHLEGEEPAPPPQQRKRLVGQSIAWACVALAFALVGVLFDKGVDVLRPPKIAPEPHAPAAPVEVQADAPLPVVLARPEVVSAYGAGRVAEAERSARRFGAVSAQAVSCGLQTKESLPLLGAAVADDITERMVLFEGTASWVPALMQDFVRSQFRIGQMRGAQILAARGKDAVCADLPSSPDYGAAVTLLRQAEYSKN